jgi:cytochrome c peroxidase
MQLSRINIVLLIIACSLVFTQSCVKDPPFTKESGTMIGFGYPYYFPKPNYTFQQNQLTKARIQLGRALFYDPILSSDSSVSCASCHQQNVAFSDNGKRFSAGVNGAMGKRNSPALFNLAWNTSFMWDGGVNHIEIMPFTPITMPEEMNEQMKHVLEKLKRSSRYKALFESAYGQDQITEKHFFYAMTQFMGAILSYRSAYDELRLGQYTFTTTEEKGLNLFRQHCNTCHTEPLFTNYTFANNGLDTVFQDTGRERITLNKEDMGKFKVPSLRNVALSTPYMHDGRFATIEQVIEHYSEGISLSNTLHPSLKQGFNFTANEKQELLAFLKTLTDTEMLSDSTLSDPKR